MHWRSDWWGIEIVADNKDDEEFLRLLVSKLNLQAEISYDVGELEVFESPEIGNYDDEKKFTISFNR